MTNKNNLINTTRLPETTDWLSESEQQFWFNQFKSPEVNGLKFIKFREFLQATLYKYFKLFIDNETTIQTDNEFNNNNCSNQFSHQQEMQLFKTFDQKNDHILDIEEFSFMCQKWLTKVYKPTCALVIVDVQNDFIDGSLALINGPAGQDGAEVVPIINNLLEANYFKTVVYTQDWHPPDHIGFHANLHLRKYQVKNIPSTLSNTISSDHNNKIKNATHLATELDCTNEILNNNEHDDKEMLKYKKMNPKAQIYDIVLFDDGRIEQKLWPTHCVQDSWGAQLHEKLKIVPDAVRIQKGTLSHVDAYSAFWDNMRMNETGLRQELQARKISDLYFCGLALDYCVAASAIDSAKAGFITYVIEDACRGIDLDEIERRKRDLKEQGVLIISGDMVTDLYNGGGVTTKCRPNVEAKHNGSMTNRRIDCNTIKSICFRRALL